MRDFNPHPYQVRGIRAGRSRPSLYIPWSMGAGKTVTALTIIDEAINQEFSVKRALVVAPLKTAETGWNHEEWNHLGGLTVNKALGSTAARLEAIKTPSDIVVINRDNFIWLAALYAKDWPFDMVVWDENWGIRDQSKTWKAIKKVRKQISRFVIMCGTPRPKSVEELHPQIWLLDGGERLGRTLTEFRNGFMEPDKRKGHQVFTWKPKRGAEDEINRRIADLMVPMAPEEYPWKPEPEPITVKVRIPMKRYNELKKELVIELKQGDIVAQTAAVLYGKLRQVASGRVYDTNGEPVHVHDEKLKALDEIIEAADGPVLLFFQYQHTLEALKERYHLASELDIEGWNRGDIGLMALHPASAGHGVDGLQQAGSIIVWVDMPDDLGLWQQANARLDRQGQTRAVRIYTIVAEGTVDELIVAGLDRKEIGQRQMLEAILRES